MTAMRYRLGQLWVHVARPRQAPEIPADLSPMVRGKSLAAFERLDGADQRHLIEVAMALKEAGWDQDVVLAGLLHDIGKGPGVNAFARGAWVILRSCWPAMARRIGSLPTPPRIGRGLWILAHHARIGSLMLGEAGYNERVCWLVRHHEDATTTDAGLRALIAADNAQRVPEAGPRR